jgi:hypothetical protein
VVCSRTSAAKAVGIGSCTAALKRCATQNQNVPNFLARLTRKQYWKCFRLSRATATARHRASRSSRLTCIYNSPQMVQARFWFPVGKKRLCRVQCYPVMSPKVSVCFMWLRSVPARLGSVLRISCFSFGFGWRSASAMR